MRTDDEQTNKSILSYSVNRQCETEFRNAISFLAMHLLIAATQLSLLEGANKDAQNPSFTPLLLLETFGPATQA